MIHYHGGPVTPNSAAIALWTRRHALVSFERTDQMALAAEVCQSFALDNGAFSHWRQGKGVIDVEAYADWVREWELHPGYDFALIPDKIDGTEEENDKMLVEWGNQRVRAGVPVWHMHESLDRLRDLAECSAMGHFPCIALGSSGEFATVGTSAWWVRMDDAMETICDELGRPICKLHGLRMLSPTVFFASPFSLCGLVQCSQKHRFGQALAWPL